MDPVVGVVLLVLFVAALWLCHAAWLDRQDRRRNARRLADRYAQPYRRKGQ